MQQPGAPATLTTDNATSFANTTIPGGGTVPRLAYRTAFPAHPTSVGPLNGEWPPGHHQPWGQIFVQDSGKAPFSASNPLCENVTFFFAITVEECYDCFYLNSFISDSTFKFQSGQPKRSPLLQLPGKLAGNGKDTLLHDLEL